MQPSSQENSRLPVSPIGPLSPADQRLVKGKQHLVEGKHVVVAVNDEVLHNDVELAAVGQGKPRPPDEVLRLLQVQLQGNGKGQRGGLGGLIGRIASDLGEQLSVDVGLFVDLRVLFAGAVDELQQGLGKAGISAVQQLLQGICPTRGSRLRGGGHGQVDKGHAVRLRRGRRARLGESCSGQGFRTAGADRVRPVSYAAGGPAGVRSAVLVP